MEFNNSQKLSLDELTFQLPEEDGLPPRTLPALHKYWAPREDFSLYIALTTQFGRVKSGADLEEWRYAAESFRDDMEFLLRCRHHEFWSYMVYRKTALAAIVSFLQRATPFYMNMCSQLTGQSTILDLYEQILAAVLRIICRLITNKETEETWLTIECQRELIYKNFLISVPMLFDLLVAVGDADPHNIAVLKRIFESLLRIEPKYKQDLLAALAFFRAAFRSIQTQADNEGVEGAGGGMLDENAETPYDDVALYTLDCAYSLSVLLEACPDVRSMCVEINLGQSIAHFYDTTIPFLYKNICLINEAAVSLGWINQARLQYLKSFRCIVHNLIDVAIAKPEDSLVTSEYFVGLLTECLSEQIFVNDYKRLYPVEPDVDILQQTCKKIDDFKMDYILEAYASEIKNPLPNKSKKTNNKKTPKSNKTQQPTAEQNVQATAVNPSRDIDLEVTAVLDVLPHLGTGFVRRVLSRYENSEEAVAAILEENLPPDLANADEKEVYLPPDPQDTTYYQTGIKHFNIFDGDKYDVMTQENPECIIKQGKGFPNAPKNVAELLDDKRDIEEIKHRYQQYSLVSEGESENEYKDEYDDSYEALLETETRVKKSKEFKSVLANVEDISDAESEEDETEPENDNSKATDVKTNVNFCENPEDVRKRYEAKFQSKSWHRSDNQRHDVVGAPKGQGQDTATSRNREKKEKNKSSRANHNRKAGAAFKRSKGMMG